jgi:retron-type reverse transcriptase
MVGIQRKKVNWILDLAVRNFFGTVSHEWLIRFLEHRIGDERILRLLRKWLKAGVLEEGIVTEGEAGTPQGATVSPLLAKPTCIMSSIFGRSSGADATPPAT